MPPLPPNIALYVRIWQWSFLAWRISYFLLGGLGVLLPAIVASGLIESTVWTKVVALTASSVSGLQFFLKCDVRADRFQLAWLTLNAAKLRYEHEENYPIGDVIGAYEKGEEMIQSAFAPADIQSLQTK